MSLGATLRRLRFKNGESLQDVATAVGASKAHVWELEVGKSKNPSLDLLRKLADHFQISLSLLIGEIPEEDIDDQDLIVLYRNIKELSAPDKELLKTIISGMKSRSRQKKDDDQD
jgi:transcriptional regulator with XRE-family HTH domain